MRKFLMILGLSVLAFAGVSSSAYADGGWNHGNQGHHGNYDHRGYHHGGSRVIIRIGGYPRYYYPTYPVYYYPQTVYVAPPAYQQASAVAPESDGYCREYQGSAVIDGVRRPTYGTACQQPDGSWQIVN